MNNFENKWIPTSERLPENEVEVLIQAIQPCILHGQETNLYTITTAHHQDGRMHTEDSSWFWSVDCNFEYCEETDDYIIPEGWFEERHYNAEDAYNNRVEDEVIAWMPLPKPYECETDTAKKGGVE